MPPYKANRSRSQERLMFVLEKEGKLAPREAVGKARATKKVFKSLPQHVKAKAPAKAKAKKKG